LQQRYDAPWDLTTAVKSAVEILGGPDSRTLEADALEAGVIDRTRTQRRKFRRLEESEIAGFLVN
jgi:proteasome alpha subunit